MKTTYKRAGKSERQNQGALELTEMTKAKTQEQKELSE
jgi:hypothetical protein